VAQLPALRPAEEAGHEDGVPLREVQGAATRPLLQGKDFLLLSKIFCKNNLKLKLAVSRKVFTADPKLKKTFS
jgi:hypothetical protein